MNTTKALAAWTALLGRDHVHDEEYAHSKYGMDTTGAVRRIAGVLDITDATLLAEVVRIAVEHQVPLYPISTGNNWGYGSSLPARNGCVIVNLGPLNKIVHFDAEFGVVTVEPGVTQGMLADFLAKGNHPFLVPVTGAGPTCSLLSNALERGYGVTPIADHFAAVTDIEAVLPDGTLYKTAMCEAGNEELARLFKWGIGPYSTGLFTQSGFGIVTKMTLMLVRRPEVVKVCLFSLKDDALLEPASQALRSIVGRLQGTVGAINLMNQHRMLSMSAPYPRDRLNAEGVIPANVLAEMGRQYQALPWTGFGTLYGTKRMVSAAQKEIRQALSGIASRLVFLTPSGAQRISDIAGKIPGPLGQRLSSTAATLARSLQLVDGKPNETALPLAYWRNTNQNVGHPRNPANDGSGLIWYAPLVPLRADDVRAYVNMVKEVTRRHGMEPLITFTTLSDKIADSTVPLVFERDVPASVEKAKACYNDLLETGRALGFFPYRVGIETMPKLVSFQKYSGAFHAKLRQSLDPHDIMAPGRYR